MPEPQTLEEYEAAQRDLYSQYVAKEPINIDGARAFNVGDPVPATHVSRGVVDKDSVAKVTTKAGQAAIDTTKGA